METLFGVVIDLELGMAEMVYGGPTKGKPKDLHSRTGPLGNAGST